MRPRSGAEDCLSPQSTLADKTPVDLNKDGDSSRGVLPQDAFDDLDLGFELPARTGRLISRDIAPILDAVAFYVPDERDRDIELSWQDQAATESDRD